jgi:hypothetical protein
MGLYNAPPKDMSLKNRNVWTYLKILRAMYQLRKERKYVISWRLLSECTALDEGIVCDASLELRANGFFDNKSREVGVVSLTSEQFQRGRLWAFLTLLRALVRQSKT